MAKCFFSTVVENGNVTKKWSPRDRRRIAEGSLTLGLKISDLLFCLVRIRNVLVFRRYVIVT